MMILAFVFSCRSVESFKEVCVQEKNADLRILQDKLLWMALMG